MARTRARSAPSRIQDLGGHALAFADQAEQDVLGAQVVVARVHGFPQRELQDLLGPWCERDGAGRRRAAPADDVLHLLADGLQRDAHGLQRLGGEPLALGEQPQEEVLGPDVVVVEAAGFVLGQHHDPPGPIGEALEHLGLPIGMPVRAVYRCTFVRREAWRALPFRNRGPCAPAAVAGTARHNRYPTLRRTTVLRSVRMNSVPWRGPSPPPE